MDLHSANKKETTAKPEEKKVETEDLQIKPAEDDDGYTWSDAQSSDLLFW